MRKVTAELLVPQGRLKAGPMDQVTNTRRVLQQMNDARAIDAYGNFGE
jgi:hypothetical protein